MLLKKLFGQKSKVSGLVENYDKRDWYIARIKPWGWLNEREIYVAAKVGDRPKMITFNFWSQEIYLDANGQITVRELVEVAKQQYVDSNIAKSGRGGQVNQYDKYLPAKANRRLFGS